MEHFIKSTEHGLIRAKRHEPWYGKDLYQLSQSEQDNFFHYKEVQYAERRERIARLCSEKTIEMQKRRGRNNIGVFYNARDQMAYCMIPKVREMMQETH